MSPKGGAPRFRLQETMLGSVLTVHTQDFRVPLLIISGELEASTYLLQYVCAYVTQWYVVVISISSFCLLFLI
jgi:hypothetical protein